MTNQRLAAALCAVSALGLAACGGSASGPSGPVTVTVTPTVTAGSAATTAQAPVAGPSSDVVGRGYDFGTITGLRRVGGVEVLTLDRWTFTGMDDARLATGGVPLQPFRGAPFQNQNDTLTYAIPVTEGARVLYHHCVAAGEPQQTRSASMTELAGLSDPERLVLVRLDRQGRVVAADNLPGCRG